MNLPEQLATEIRRVARLQCRLEDLRGIHGADPEPVLAMMEAALDRAVAAAGSGDVLDRMQAVEELRGFVE